MKRREFIGLIGGTVAWPFAVRAQQSPLQVVGFLGSASFESTGLVIGDFRSGLAAEGFLEGKNVTIEFRFADGKYEQLPALAEDLVRRQVRVVATGGGSPASFAIHAATKTIPIVSLIGGNAVKMGLVESLSHPGGNVTGVEQLLNDAEIKRLEILHEIVPTAELVAYIQNPNTRPANQASVEQTAVFERAAIRLGKKLLVLNATNDSELDQAFATIDKENPGGLIVGADAFFFMRVNRIVEQAAARRMPAIYFFREYVRAGGLVSYGTRLGDAMKQVGIYVGKILKGAKASDLPIVQLSEKIELLVNLKTARALGISVPTSLLLRADEVIE
jgi:putative tryptophan/tyrosine transport system substrate-binding protein